MSKSDPDSAIFMEDSEQEVKTKIKKAYCPPCTVEKNPCIEYVRHLVLPRFGEFAVDRSADNGGRVVYTSMAPLVADYEAGALHPGDLKPALAQAINAMIAPGRAHFDTNPDAAKLLKQVKAFKVTK